MDKEKCIEKCNELLRGELAAAETYGKVIEKFSAEPSAEPLRSIQEDHFKNIQMLEKSIIQMGGKPSKDSGTWGTFSNALTNCSTLLGEDAAVGVLKQGEEHGKSQYENALEEDFVLPECKEQIRSHLLPNTVSHITRLGTL